MAWNSSSLKPIELNKTFKANLKKAHGRIIEAKFVGKNNKYFFMKVLIKDSKTSSHKTFYIYSRETGQLLFSYDNANHSHSPNGEQIAEDSIEDVALFVLDVMICEKVTK